MLPSAAAQNVRRLVAAFGLLALLSAPAAAEPSPADRAAADVLFNDAKKLASEGRFVEACPKYAESQRLDPGVGTLLYLAECYEKTARLASAWITFREAADMARAVGQNSREKVAVERASALERRLPRLLIELEGAAPAGLEVRRDGVVVGAALFGTAVPLDQGKHTISASAPGRRAWSTSVELGEGSTSKVKIPALEVESGTPSATSSGTKPPPTASVTSSTSIAPTVPTSLSTRKTAALISGGVGLVGLGLGAYFGLHAISLWNEKNSNDNCVGTRCNQAGFDAGSKANSSATASTVLFAVGLVGVGAGAALWLWPESSPSTALRVRPGFVSLEGRWLRAPSQQRSFA